MNKIMKKKEILDWLESGKPLTALMAVQLFGTMNLSRIISSLRKEGHKIEIEMIAGANGQKFGKYFIAK